MSAPDETKLDGSLWTTPTLRAASLDALKGDLIDPAATRETIAEAIEAVRERTQAFSGRVSDEAMRKSVG